jgi:hypothetical protein
VPAARRRCRSSPPRRWDLGGRRLHSWPHACWRIRSYTFRPAAPRLPDLPTHPLPSGTQVNLFLRVVRRREDGYHDLASLFHVRLGGDGLGGVWRGVPAALPL